MRSIDGGDEEEFKRNNQAMLDGAKWRPALYIGSVTTGHRLSIESAIELAWKARVFKRPTWAEITISPHQFAVRIESGALIDELQRLYRFGVGRAIDSTWHKDSEPYFKKWDEEDKELEYNKTRFYKLRWLYYQRGPCGPRLNTPSNLSVFAKTLHWGLQTDQGLWCDSYEDGWLTGRPLLLPDQKTTGLFAAGHLTSEFCQGLPFKPDEFNDYQQPNGIKFGKYDRRWTPPNDVRISWHENDDIIPTYGNREEIISQLLTTSRKDNWR